MKLSDQLAPLIDRDNQIVPSWLAKQWHEEAKRLEEIETESHAKANGRIRGFAETRKAE